MGTSFYHSKGCSWRIRSLLGRTLTLYCCSRKEKSCRAEFISMATNFMRPKNLIQYFHCQIPATKISLMFHLKVPWTWNYSSFSFYPKFFTACATICKTWTCCGNKLTYLKNFGICSRLFSSMYRLRDLWSSSTLCFSDAAASKFPSSKNLSRNRNILNIF